MGLGSGKIVGLSIFAAIFIFIITVILLVSVGNIHHHFIFPAPQPSYNINTSPKIQIINGVPTLWNSTARSRGFLLYLHGNGVDIGMIRGNMHSLARNTQLTVLAPEYPGYGICPGPPSPLGAVSAARRVYEYIQDNKSPNDIVVVMGRSIGTGVAAQMIRRIIQDQSTTLPDYLVLLSPFLSIEKMGARMAGKLGKTVCKNIYKTVDAIQMIDIPTLVMVGSEDKLTPPEDAIEIHNKSIAPKKSLQILQGNDHIVLDWVAIYTFIKQFTIPTPQKE